MLILKEIVIISVILILGSAGLVEISIPSWNYSSQNKSETTSGKLSERYEEKKDASDEFFFYMDLDSKQTNCNRES